MKKIFCFIFAVLILLGSLPLATLAAGFIPNPMEKTDVVEDLKAMNFTLDKYPLDPSASFVSVIDLMEYGYHYKGDYRYYGLYVYVYNPTGKAVDTVGNSLQLSYIYRNDNGEETKDTYKKYGLELMSVSSGTGLDNVLLKFKVTTSRAIANRVQDYKREYLISGIELKHSGDSNAKDFPQEQHWIYEGYQENFGKEETGKPLRYKKNVLEVVRTELRSANWFSNTSDLGEDYRYLVSSVYFTVPDYFINEYGNPVKTDRTSGLHSVRGEYYRYITNGLVVQSDDLYNEFLKIPSTVMGPLPEGQSWNKYGFYDYKKPTTTSFNEYKAYYCGFSYALRPTLILDKGNVSIKNAVGIVDPLCNVIKDTDVSDGFSVQSDDFLKAYIEQGKNKTYSDLFVGDKVSNPLYYCGYQDYYITCEDQPINDSIKSYASSHKANWLYKLFNKELYADENGYPECLPLVEISDSDTDTDGIFGIGGKDPDAVIKKLFITRDDLEELQTFYDEYDSGNHIYLMRFDVQPYYAKEVTICDASSGDSIDQKGLYFETPVYENFDVLEFTFHDESGGLTTVPVSCDPIDIVPSIVPGNNKVEPNPNDPTNKGDTSMDWLKDLWNKLKDMNLLTKIVILVIGIILLIWLLSKVPMFVFKGVGWIVSAPFKGAAAGIRAVRNASDRRRDRKDHDEDREYKRQDYEYKDKDDKRKDDDNRRKDDRNRRDEEIHSSRKKESDQHKKLTEDFNKQLKNERAAKKSKNNKSFDVDSFFNAAVDRTRRDFDDLDK